MQVIYVLAQFRKPLPDILHKCGFACSRPAFDAYNPVCLPLSENIPVVRKKSLRRIVAWEIVSFDGQGTTSYIKDTSYYAGGLGKVLKCVDDAWSSRGY